MLLTHETSVHDADATSLGRSKALALRCIALGQMGSTQAAPRHAAE